MILKYIDKLRQLTYNFKYELNNSIFGGYFMNKKIKQINMTFENCESVVIPNVCIKKLDYKLDKKDNIINLDCIIENDGSICSNPFDNKSPIQRINEYDDITSIDIIYTDNSSNNYCVSWYDDGYYHIQSSNKNQYSKILRYNKNKKYEEYVFEPLPDMTDAIERYKQIHGNDMWNYLRDCYYNKKTKNADTNKKSFQLLNEAVMETLQYFKIV